MRFARRVFQIAGVWGVLVTAPLYFTEEKTGRDFPPPINHPEFYYGFAGTVLAWQVAFFLIARAPERYRPLMLVAALEKLSFAAAAAVLYGKGRVAAAMLGFGMVDLVLAFLFLAAYRATSPARPTAQRL